jgi:uncharacterized protein (TIGR00290 family)
MKKEKAILFWSGGKDAALALHRTLKKDNFEVVSLVTTLSKEFKRSSMHGVREELMDQQANEIGIPLHKMWMTIGTNEAYEELFLETINFFKDKGVSTVIFGDIFLEDLKIYRNNLLEQSGMKGHYPLWKENTMKLLEEGISIGLKTVVCAASDKFFDESFVGEVLSKELITEYPQVDPCGENGEYHSFIVEAPYFAKRIEYKLGEKVVKSFSTDDAIPKFWFVDLVL